MVIRPPTRLTVQIDEDVGQALIQMCEQDLRHPKQQVKWILRAEAERRGLLTNREAAGAKFADQTPTAS